MPVIEISQLSYCYNENKPPALQDISLQIDKGQFVGISGANNSGKSTLCYTITGVVPHLFRGKLTGSITINGASTLQQSVSELSSQVGLVLQKPDNQISGMRFTVFEEVALGLENRGVERKQIQTRVEEMLDLMDLSSHAERSPFHLSGGQQQRLALASVLAVDPPALVLDEPTTFLDPHGALHLFSILKNLQENGKIIIISEQRTDLLAAFADRIVVLQKGRITQDASPKEVFTTSDIETLGITRTRYTKAAELAQQKGFWQKDHPLPVTLSDTVAGLHMEGQAVEYKN